MPIEVELPDGTIVEFPDGTKPQTMEMALARYKDSAKPKADFSGVSGKFDAPVARKPATYSPAGIPGVGTQLGGMLDGAQHHLLNIQVGLGQLAQHGINAGANLLPEGNGVREYVNRETEQGDAQLRQREADYQARTAGNA